jgi:hypothetical protein
VGPVPHPLEGGFGFLGCEALAFGPAEELHPVFIDEGFGTQTQGGGSRLLFLFLLRVRGRSRARSRRRSLDGVRTEFRRSESLMFRPVTDLDGGRHSVAFV